MCTNNDTDTAAQVVSKLMVDHRFTREFSMNLWYLYNDLYKINLDRSAQEIYNDITDKFFEKIVDNKKVDCNTDTIFEYSKKAIQIVKDAAKMLNKSEYDTFNIIKMTLSSDMFDCERDLDAYSDNKNAVIEQITTLKEFGAVEYADAKMVDDDGNEITEDFFDD